MIALKDSTDNVLNTFKPFWYMFFSSIANSFRLTPLNMYQDNIWIVTIVSQWQRLPLFLAGFCHTLSHKSTFSVTLVTEFHWFRLVSVTNLFTNPQFSLHLWQNFTDSGLFLSQTSSQTHNFRYTCDRISLIPANLCHKLSHKSTFSVTLVTGSH